MGNSKKIPIASIAFAYGLNHAECEELVQRVGACVDVDWMGSLAGIDLRHFIGYQPIFFLRYNYRDKLAEYTHSLESPNKIIEVLLEYCNTQIDSSISVETFLNELEFHRILENNFNADEFMNYNKLTDLIFYLSLIDKDDGIIYLEGCGYSLKNHNVKGISKRYVDNIIEKYKGEIANIDSRSFVSTDLVEQYEIAAEGRTSSREKKELRAALYQSQGMPDFEIARKLNMSLNSLENISRYAKHGRKLSEALGLPPLPPVQKK